MQDAITQRQIDEMMNLFNYGTEGRARTGDDRNDDLSHKNDL